MSITTITRSLNEFTVFHAMKDVTHDHVATFSVAAGGDNPLAEADPYFAGVRFHALLRRIADYDALTPAAKAI
jgi:hypothetical protein